MRGPRTLFRVLVVTSTLLGMAGPCLAQTANPGLADLESWARHNALDNRIAQVDLDIMRQKLQAISAGNGVELFASTGWSRNRDVVSDTSTVSYQTLSSQIGFRVPLLGAADKQQDAVRSARLDATQAEERLKATQRTVTQMVLKANAELYFSLRAIDLDNAYLAHEDRYRALLQHRAQTHRLLVSDQLNDLATLDTARQSLRTQRQTAAALRTLLHDLTQHDLSAYVPSKPSFGSQAAASARANECADRLSSVKFAQNNLRAQQDRQTLLRWEGIDAYLNVARTFDRGIGVPSGGSSSISLQLKIPLAIGALRSATQDAAQMQSLKAELKLQQARQKANRDIQSALDVWSENSGALRARRRQLQAAYAAWDIAYKRVQHVPDALETSFLARAKLYQAAASDLDAQRTVALAAIDFVAMCDTIQPLPGADDAPVPPPTPADDASVSQNLARFAAAPWRTTLQALQTPLPGSMTAATDLGWYVWHPWKLISDRASWNDIPKQTRRLALSFTARQLDELAHSAASRQALNTFIAHAHQRHIAVTWLIGDPTLALPAGRAFLRAQVPLMQGFAFDAIDLDIERSQLPAQEQADWRSGVLRTVAELHRLTAWPITLTLNWRTFVEPGFGAALERVGVGGVNVMLYARNPQRAASLMRRLLAANPGLPLSLAQSVETNLPSDETLAPLGRAGALKQWAELEHELHEYPNYRGVMVQSWLDFQQLQAGTGASAL